MSKPTKAQAKALIKLIGDAIIKAVKAAGPMEAPGGHIYMALMAHGCTLEQFEMFMSTLVRIGMLKKRGDRYFSGDAT